MDVGPHVPAVDEEKIRASSTSRGVVLCSRLTDFEPLEAGHDGLRCRRDLCFVPVPLSVNCGSVCTVLYLQLGEDWA